MRYQPDWGFWLPVGGFLLLLAVVIACVIAFAPTDEEICAETCPSAREGARMVHVSQYGCICETPSGDRFVLSKGGGSDSSTIIFIPH